MEPRKCESFDVDSKIKCSGIENGRVTQIVESGNDAVPVPELDSNLQQERKELVISEDKNKLPSTMLSMLVPKESEEENCKDVTEIPSEDIVVPISDGKIVLQNDAVGIPGKTYHECSKPTCSEAQEVPISNTLGTETRLTSAVGVEMKIAPQLPFDKSEDGALIISEIPVIDQVGTGELLQDPCPYKKNDAEVSVTAAVEDRKSSEDVLVDADLSKSQLISALEEDESAESKERFRQRLWCFLFENLNRAVDELYLLCELECDVEQMKEVTLVLEEAASDFRELKRRVEGFDHVKKSSSQQLKDGSPLNLKTDHQRAHALSWEVRRMASSPHRAEILSSSLEAFKKIQQERASKCSAHEMKTSRPACSTHYASIDSPVRNNLTQISKEPDLKMKKSIRDPDFVLGNTGSEKLNTETSRLSKARLVQNNHLPPQSMSTSDTHVSQAYLKNGAAASAGGKGKKESLASISEMEKQMPKKDRMLTESKLEKFPKFPDNPTKHRSLTDKEKEKEKRNTTPWKSMDAWKEKRNWEAILASPAQSSSRVVSHSPAISRKSAERARVLHDKLMSPEKKKKSALDMKREAEEKHARAMRIRSELENERVQRLQRTSEKLNRVNEWQAVRSMKLREGMFARHQRSESRYEAHLAEVVRRAGDESSKVNEVRFITSLNEENKKLMLRQKLHDSEMRRAEKLQVIRTKQKEDLAREEAVLERKKLLEAEKLQRLAETQRKKEEALIRREEERRASSAAREAKAVEQLRRKEVRAKAQQEEAELLAQKLAERLSESEQRRKFYLEQIREKASMDFRDQSSPSLRRSSNKESQVRTAATNTIEDFQASCAPGVGDSSLGIGSAVQNLLKRRIKKVRQRLMALKYEFIEPPVGAESVGIGYRAQVGAARAKIGRWLQDLQKLRQARKEGAASIGLTVGDMIKFLEGKETELHASRQAGLLDFIASALPASHTSKPEACQITVYLLQLLKVVLSIPANRSYFLAQNLLPPIIPMLSAALENYIKIAASMNIPGGTSSLSSKTPVEKLESISEVLEGFLWTVTTIIGHNCCEERQLQMRDGLMVLLVAYQVIHRLRDLFALYDRPQVEGYPLPSSILLSLNLLAILTSRSRSVSTIDWESYLSKQDPGTKNQEIKLAEATESVDVAIQTSGCISALYGGFKSFDPQNTIVVTSLNQFCQNRKESSTNGVHLSDVPEDQLSNDQCRFSGSEDLSLVTKDSGKGSADISNGLCNSDAASRMHTEVTSVESDKCMMKLDSKPHLSQRDVKSTVDVNTEQNNRLPQNEEQAECIKNENEKGVSLNQPISFLVSAIAETGLVSLLSLLTAVLLQANNRLSSEQGSAVLPSNFEEVATGVLKVLNNLALLDITLLQTMLARPDLQMEFFHLMSFLLSHCTNKWKTATDQVGLLLLESLLLLGYFALFHPGNQAVLRWGKSPTILHKVCDLPFVFFSDPELTPILAGTLVAGCYGCEQNRGVVQQELSMEMLLSLLKSCKQGLSTIQSEPSAGDTTRDDASDGNQLIPEPRKLQGDLPIRSNRNSRNTRVLSGRGAASGCNARVGKVKSQKDNKGTRTCTDWAIKHNLPASEASSGFMLHIRFPSSFIDRAEEFFSAGTPSSSSSTCAP